MGIEGDEVKIMAGLDQFFSKGGGGHGLDESPRDSFNLNQPGGRIRSGRDCSERRAVATLCPRALGAVSPHESVESHGGSSTVV